MPTELFDRYGKREATYVRFINDVAPKFVIPDPALPGYWIPGSGHMETTKSTPADVRLTAGQRSSNRTPLFHSDKRPYLVPPQPFFFEKKRFSAEGVTREWVTPDSVHIGPGSGSYYDNTSYYTNFSTYGRPANPLGSWRSRLVDQATRSLIKSIRDSSFNAAQAIAERKQTANLFASTATRVAKSMRNLRKGNFKGAARDLGVLPRKRALRRFNSDYAVDQAKAIGNGWLELQYGWKPLLSDVYGSMEELAKANVSGNPNTFFKRSSGRAMRKEVLNTKTNSTLPSGAKGNDSVLRNFEFEMYVRTGVTYQISSPPLKSLASVGISNPLLLAWELVPYSFVVDWFLPLGNYLESLDATNGLTFHSGYVTVLEKSRGTIFHDRMYNFSGGKEWRYANELETYDDVTCRRTTLSSFPSMPYPTFKNPLSSSHVASALALLLQTFKK